MTYNEFCILMDMEYLAHHGVKGQKWGVRRYQNPDGTLTSKGRAKQKKISKLTAKSNKLAVKAARKQMRSTRKLSRATTDDEVSDALELQAKANKLSYKSAKYKNKATKIASRMTKVSEKEARQYAAAGEEYVKYIVQMY